MAAPALSGLTPIMLIWIMSLILSTRPRLMGCRLRLELLLKHFRRWLGVQIYDRFKVELLLSCKSSYLRIANRSDVVSSASYGPGVSIDGLWTSELHVANVLPAVGLRIMRRALADHPVVLHCTAVAPVSYVTDFGTSIVIGHRGLARLPLLLKTLASFRAQAGVSFEVVVVEQDFVPRIGPFLPDWVRHVWSRPFDESLPYSRSWAFNVGAQFARGQVLFLHDNDLLVPTDYISGILDRIREGAQVVNAKRFVFYMSQRTTEAVCAGSDSLLAEPPTSIVQNALGGGSVAITRQSFLDIGGMDESFVGWGGEDNEFWDRAQTLRVWNYGWLSLVHLWHAAQPGKQDLSNPTLARLDALLKIPAAERIATLKAGAGQSTLGDVIDLGYGRAS
jgi:N-terminal domain of galactosyltransferase/Glycosyl transferase family 2